MSELQSHTCGQKPEASLGASLAECPEHQLQGTLQTVHVGATSFPVTTFFCDFLEYVSVLVSEKVTSVCSLEVS